jgi:hypothetical protein
LGGEKDGDPLRRQVTCAAESSALKQVLSIGIERKRNQPLLNLLEHSLRACGFVCHF